MFGCKIDIDLLTYKQICGCEKRWGMGSLNILFEKWSLTRKRKTRNIVSDTTYRSKRCRNGIRSDEMSERNEV